MMRIARPDLSSLRTRLVLIPAAIVFLGLAATIGFIVAGARARVEAEVDSGMRLGRLLIHDALRDVDASADPGHALARFAATLPRVRHVDFIVLPGAVPESAPPVRERGWFFRALAPRRQSEAFPVTVRGTRMGTVVMRSNPANEIAEIRGEVVLLGALLAGVGVLITAMIFWAVGRSLRPLRVLSDAFDRLEHGHFAALPPIEVAELRRIGARFNSLGRTLERVKADNNLLIDRLMSLQEAERKELARELHDEFGPALFGIRADAACIVRWSRDARGPGTDIEERAHAIAALTDTIQKMTYGMLARLRPVVLEQMGLEAALRQLMSSWQDRAPEITFSLHVSGVIDPCDEPAALTVFRAVQESITNAVRHAKAGAVVVVVSERDRVMHIAAQDDGSGLPSDFRFGYGLLGMAERIRRLEGNLSVRNHPERGTMVEIVVPLARTRSDTCASC